MPKKSSVKSTTSNLSKRLTNKQIGKLRSLQTLLQYLNKSDIVGVLYNYHGEEDSGSGHTYLVSQESHDVIAKDLDKATVSDLRDKLCALGLGDNYGSVQDLEESIEEATKALKEADPDTYAAMLMAMPDLDSDATIAEDIEEDMYDMSASMMGSSYGLPNNNEGGACILYLTRDTLTFMGAYGEYVETGEVISDDEDDYPETHIELKDEASCRFVNVPLDDLLP